MLNNTFLKLLLISLLSGWFVAIGNPVLFSPIVVLLHCVTEYPTPMDEVNLNAMLTLREAFGVPVGYSDHTGGIEVCVAAATALGAQVLEKHFTLDRNMEGPDHQASLEPNELKEMITACRNVQKAMGDGIKRPAKCEQKNIDVVRKSLVASQVIEDGQQLTAEMIQCKRPGTGIQPGNLPEVVGRVANRRLAEDEVITWNDIS